MPTAVNTLVSCNSIKENTSVNVFLGFVKIIIIYFIILIRICRYLSFRMFSAHGIFQKDVEQAV